MITLRSFTSKIPHKITHQRSYIQHRFPLIPASISSCSPFSTETGTVVLYNNSKSFGFITADSDQKDLFVHRRNIRGAPEDDNMNPVLKKGERVMFRRVLHDAADDGNDSNKMRAIDVVYENGERIPVFRGNHMQRVTRNVEAKLGKQVYEILTEGGDEIEIAEKIAKAYIDARETIETMQKKIDREMGQK